MCASRGGLTAQENDSVGAGGCDSFRMTKRADSLSSIETCF